MDLGPLFLHFASDSPALFMCVPLTPTGDTLIQCYSSKAPFRPMPDYSVKYAFQVNMYQ